MHFRGVCCCEIHTLLRHCEALKKPKQSTNATRESNANRLLCENLKQNLLIRFWVIDFVFLLNSRDLDCHDLPKGKSRNDGGGR